MINIDVFHFNFSHTIIFIHYSNRSEHSLLDEVAVDCALDEVAENSLFNEIAVDCLLYEVPVHCLYGSKRKDSWEN